MANSSIEWCDKVWNPVRGCSRVSEGCRNCYAERQASRFAGKGLPYEGFAAGGKWTGEVSLIEDKLTEPLHWRTPQRVFVNSMSDLFHESLDDEDICRVFAVMAVTPHLTYQVLTKRPRGMLEFFASEPWDLINAWAGEYKDWGDMDDCTMPPQNVWLGVSVEDQTTADERIPLLLKIPAAVRFLSVEPLLGPVDLRLRCRCGLLDDDGHTLHRASCDERRDIDWVIVGGESGPRARPCDVSWIRSIVTQCRMAGVPVFVKQLGSRPIVDVAHATNHDRRLLNSRDAIKDRKGGDPAEWPVDLRVREFPEPKP